eukprot:TRINITY_DN2585_c0_g1_i1.p1 TRINITY_DN2585_c0_g1~~TRINITY_DN2585_c0_g1_i1.p1  ORF type:complete len:238 (-),score=51.34 TRINITY_DN2585_c0_g1_i1:882-1595(-)
MVSTLDAHLKTYFAEFLGTFLFQIIGGSGGNVNTSEGWAVAACLNGIGLVVIIYLTANISGGHVNPAVSIGLAVQGSFHWIDFAFYAFSQILGAICGAGVLKWFLPSDVNMCATDSDFGKAFVAEFIFTFLLVAVVIACVIPKEGGHGSLSPVAIGLVVFLAAIAVGGISGAYLNPARLIGPSVVYGCDGWKGWALLLAQFPGGAVAGAYGILMYGAGQNYVKKIKVDDELQQKLVV